jgi:hypothetical protein
MDQPPAELQRHENAFWQDELLLIKGCENCQTSLKMHDCGDLKPIEYVVFDRGFGLNQKRFDSLRKNAEKTFIPDELKIKPNWVRWKLEQVNGRLTKVPYQLNGNRASSTDPATWNTYKAIVKGAVIDETQGIGIMTDGSFVGFDLDGCRNPVGGEITEWAKRIIALLGSYCEITPSGTGVRVYALGKLPDGARRFSLAVSAGFGDKVGIETYSEQRYFTVTGNRLGENSTLQSQNTLKAYELCAQVSREFPSEKRKGSASFQSSDSNNSTVVFEPAAGVLTSKLAVLMYGKIKSCPPLVVEDEYGSKVTAPSQSEADMSLATLLAIKHGEDADAIDSDFRESALYRPKWDRLAESTVKKAIQSAKRLSAKPPQNLAMSQSVIAEAKTNLATAPPIESEAPPEMPDIPFPKFPEWIMFDGSLYKNYVKPYCDVNSRISYFMWMPAMALLLNTLGTKIKIKNKNHSLSIYNILVGKKGQTTKSSCLSEAVEYFQYADLARHDSQDIKNAEGKSLVFSAGSAEGLCLDIQRSSCRNAVLLYDELSTLVKKIGIEASSLGGALLAMYESKKQANSVKRTKEKYSLEPGQYVLSVVTACTLKNFPETWATLATGNDGMDDRFTFTLQPEILPEKRVQKYVNTVAGAWETRKLIEKAIAKREYEIEDESPLQAALKWMTNRDEIRAEKYALGIAVDAGLEAIDDACVEKAIALVRYEQEVKKYLKTSDAHTKNAVAQLKIRDILEKAKGRMPKRDLLRKMRHHEYGTDMWGYIYGGLLKHGVIREEGTGKPGDPAIVQLMQVIEGDSDE